MNLTEAFGVLLKGRSYGVGAIRTWSNGRQYQKQTDGKWVEYSGVVKQGATKEEEPKSKEEKLNDLKSKILKDNPSVSISVFALKSGDDDYLNISKIIVPKELRNSGMGTKVMKEFLGFVKNEKMTTSLTPSEDYGGNKKKLVGFYKRLGFVENKGKNKDYGTTEAMIKPY